MAYFAPYIDGTGLHMPTYEERLEDLVAGYRNIFGIEAELSPAVPDYQLLSVFAKALDDVSGLVLQGFNARNPLYATGAALDLLLSVYGITRAAGETDASVRARMRNSLAARGAGSTDAILAAVKAARSVKDAKLYVNDTDAADSIGIPAHSIAVVTRGGNANAIAQAIWDTKAPGIGAWGASTGTAYDADGNAYTVKFTRYQDSIVYVYLFVKKLAGADETAIRNAIIPAVLKYIDQLGLAVDLNIPQLYGVAYAANPAISNTFAVTDIQVSQPGGSSVIRDVIPCAWNQKITAIEGVGVTVNFTN